MATTTLSTPAPAPTNSTPNPTNLPPRYSIRRLGPEHADWAKAIVCHSNIFHSPVWPLLYPDNKTQRLYDLFRTAEHLVSHQIASGLSFGIFDNEYVFKRPTSTSAPDPGTDGGKLYWDASDPTATSDELLSQMDFPLASVALSYDAARPFDQDRIKPVVDVLPEFGTIYHVLELRDPRDPAAWKPSAPGQVLMRNATSTRRDYEGQGLMRKLAQWLMREAAGRGFRGIQIECAHDAVSNTWANPPVPFRGVVVSELDSATYEEEDGEGGRRRPLGRSRQVCTKVYVHLKPESEVADGGVDAIPTAGSNGVLN